MDMDVSGQTFNGKPILSISRYRGLEIVEIASENAWGRAYVVPEINPDRGHGRLGGAHSAIGAFIGKHPHLMRVEIADERGYPDWRELPLISDGMYRGRRIIKVQYPHNVEGALWYVEPPIPPGRPYGTEQGAHRAVSRFIADVVQDVRRDGSASLLRTLANRIDSHFEHLMPDSYALRRGGGIVVRYGDRLYRLTVSEAEHYADWLDRGHMGSCDDMRRQVADATD